MKAVYTPIRKYFAKLKSYNLVGRFSQRILYSAGMPFGKPDCIILELTHRCNSRCKTCNYWKNKSNESEITLEEWKEIILSMKSWLGNFDVIISGGEPLVKKDIAIGLIKFSTGLGLRPLLCTNALALDQGAMDSLITAGLKNVSISLNSLDEKKHDKSRGINGGYKKAKNAIQYLQGKGLQVSIDSIIFPDEPDEMIRLLEWVQEKGLDSIFFNMLHPTKDCNRPEMPKTSEVNIEKLCTALDRMKGMKLEGYPLSNTLRSLNETKRAICNEKGFVLKCLCGVRRFAILPNGDIKLCPRKRSIGNILNKNPREIWFSDRAKGMRKKIKNCSLKCDPTGGISCNTQKNPIIDIYSLIRRFGLKSK